MKRYPGDPYWLNLRFPGKCRKCGADLCKGSLAFRYKDGSLYGKSCGHGDAAEADFLAAAEDEEFYNRES